MRRMCRSRSLRAKASNRLERRVAGHRRRLAEGAASAHEAVCVAAFLLVEVSEPRHEMLFDAHTRCLTGLGGVAGRGIYDNMETVVDRTPAKTGASSMRGLPRWPRTSSLNPTSAMS